MEELSNTLNSIAKNQPYEIRWHLQDLTSGVRSQKGGEEVIPSASTRKVAILMTALQGVTNNQWSLSDKITITAESQEGNFIGAILDCFDPGIDLSLREHLVMMITLSDNVSTRLVAEKIGLPAINEFCESIGMTDTVHRKAIPDNTAGIIRDPMAGNVTTPKNQGILLEKIITGREDPAVAEELGCTPSQCQMAIDIMKRQKYRQRLPALLPVGAKVGHKTGTVVHEWKTGGTPVAKGFHDIGIVFENDTPLYTIALFTNTVPGELPNGWPPSAHASHTIARMNRLCWEYITNEELPNHTYDTHNENNQQ